MSVEERPSGSGAIVVHRLERLERRAPNRYDEEADLLIVNVDGSPPWSTSGTVVVEDTVVCTTNVEHVLLQFKLLRSRKSWRVDPELGTPVVAYSGALQFTSDTLTGYTADDPATSMLTNIQYSAVCIRFGDPEVDEIWIALSTQCMASIAGSRLKGFFVHLAMKQ